MSRFPIPNTFLHCGDNVGYMKQLDAEGTRFDLIYADMMYDDMDFLWVLYCRNLLKNTGSLFVQTDHRSVAELKIYMDQSFGKENFVNWIIWPYDWGGRSKNRFARKHDDILWYSRSKDYKFFPENVKIPKVTAGSEELNPSGRNWKIPTDVWQDIGNFHTMDSERVKDADGINYRWQKPLRLIERIVLATTEEGDIVLDPFCGTGTTPVVCSMYGRHCLACDTSEEMIGVTMERIFGADRESYTNAIRESM